MDPLEINNKDFFETTMESQFMHRSYDPIKNTIFSKCITFISFIIIYGNRHKKYAFAEQYDEWFRLEFFQKLKGKCE